MYKVSLAALLALATTTAPAAIALADAPAAPSPSAQVVNVQGVLRNAAGSLQSAAFGLDVALFPAASGGSTFYTQHFPTVPVENGYFSIELAGAGLDFSAAPDAWVEVQVAGDSAPLPRMHLAAVPYALQCANATTLAGQGAAYYVDTASDQTIAGNKSFSGKATFAADVSVAANVSVGANVTVAGDLVLNGASISTTINVRSIVPYNSAATYCPSGSVPSYVPRSWMNKTGAEICAADNGTGPKRRTCVAAKQVWVAADNTSGAYPPTDLDCSKPIAYPWPWGQDYGSPDTTGGEWGHGNTWVVCCQ
jgi:hypothetical protein